MHTARVRKQACSCVAMMVCGKDVCGNVWLCVWHCGALCGDDGVQRCVAVFSTVHGNDCVQMHCCNGNVRRG